MAREITKTFQEAIDMVSDCKIVAKPQIQTNTSAGDTALFLLEDPAGQAFVLRITARATPKLNGTMLTVDASHAIHCLELEAGDTFGGQKF